MLTGWELTRAKIDEVHTMHKDEFVQATIENARVLATSIENICPPPDTVGKGYRATMRFGWSVKPHAIEVEIFEDSFEFYRFAQGETEIKAFAVGQEKPVPQGLIELLAVAQFRS